MGKVSRKRRARHQRRHILITPDRSHVEVKDMNHAMTLLCQQNITIELLLDKLSETGYDRT